MKFLLKISDYLCSRYLGFRGGRHLRDGFEHVATFAFDHIAHEINLKGRYEVAELSSTVDFLKLHSRIAGCAIDVGANIGNHALFFSRYYDKVIALEPNPKVFELLLLNSKLKNNVIPLNMAASDCTGEMQLSFSADNWGGGHLLPVSDKSPEAVTVSAKRLDDLAEIASLRIGLIKIDVEGHELPVLKGAAGVLKQWRPVVLFEQQPVDISGNSSETIDWLRGQGYDRFYEVRSFPGLPRNWTFPGRKWVNALMRLFLGERKRVVPIVKFDKVFYPMIIALPKP